jgi:DNA recombination protein RmuC
MMVWLLLILGLLVGAAAGAGVAIARAMSIRAALQAELANAQTRSQMLDEQARTHLAEIDRVRAEIDRINQQREAAERQAALTHQQLQAKQQQFDEQKQLLEQAEKKLTDTFASVGGKALRDNNAQFLELARQTFEKLMKEASGDVDKKQQAIDNLVKPIKELLEKQNTALTDIEKKREADKSGLQKHLELIAQAHEKLNTETGKLVNALRRPEVRGKWGENQLRNVVELSGMMNHCDFLEQETFNGEDGRSRPDLIVRLPGESLIVVDAKVSLSAYFDALECDEPEKRAECLRRHARQVADHIAGLADKRYWDAVTKIGKRTPKLVVMFVSPESALVSALESNPSLQNDAMSQHVLIATPTLLVALLRAIAYGWQQEDVAANARQISDAGRELYERIGKFVDNLECVGRNLNSATSAYNKAIGTLESRVLVSTRKLKDLHATTEAEIESPPPIEIEVRPIIAPELKSLPASVD